MLIDEFHHIFKEQNDDILYKKFASDLFRHLRPVPTSYAPFLLNTF